MAKLQEWSISNKNYSQRRYSWKFVSFLWNTLSGFNLTKFMYISKRMKRIDLVDYLMYMEILSLESADLDHECLDLTHYLCITNLSYLFRDILSIPIIDINSNCIHIIWIWEIDKIYEKFCTESKSSDLNIFLFLLRESRIGYYRYFPILSVNN